MKDVSFNRITLASMENKYDKTLKAFNEAQVGYEETHRQHEPRIVKLEKEVDLLNTKVGSLQVAIK